MEKKERKALSHCTANHEGIPKTIKHSSLRLSGSCGFTDRYFNQKKKERKEKKKK